MRSMPFKTLGPGGNLVTSDQLPPPRPADPVAALAELLPSLDDDDYAAALTGVLSLFEPCEILAALAAMCAPREEPER